jgi:hypothetical protein
MVGQQYMHTPQRFDEHRNKPFAHSVTPSKKVGGWVEFNTSPLPCTPLRTQCSHVTFQHHPPGLRPGLVSNYTVAITKAKQRPLIMSRQHLNQSSAKTRTSVHLPTPSNTNHFRSAKCSLAQVRCINVSVTTRGPATTSRRHTTGPCMTAGGLALTQNVHGNSLIITSAKCSLAQVRCINVSVTTRGPATTSRRHTTGSCVTAGNLAHSRNLRI